MTKTALTGMIEKLSPQNRGIAEKFIIFLVKTQEEDEYKDSSEAEQALKELQKFRGVVKADDVEELLESAMVEKYGNIS